jgi:hypothetical protein
MVGQNMSNRPKIPPQIEAAVLVKSGRRCCLCFGLHRDLTIKRGQIAHVDRDRANNDEKNLAFLCFDHHDEYDSTTRQSKGFTQFEVVTYRQRLYEAVAVQEPSELRSVKIIASNLEAEEAVLGVMERYFEIGDVSPDVLSTEIYSRLRQIIRYIEALLSFYEQLEQMDDNIGEEEEERLAIQEKERLRRAFGLPEAMWEPGAEEELDEVWLEDREILIQTWVNGHADYSTCTNLFVELDENHDLDPHFILFGLPNRSLSTLGYRALISFIYEYGMRNRGNT